MFVLKQLRKQRGITQQQLADELGIMRATVTMYETGKISPSLEVLSKLAKYFNVSVDYLLTPELLPPVIDLEDLEVLNNIKKPVIELDIFSRFALELRRIDLEEHDLQKLLDFARFLKEQKWK